MTPAVTRPFGFRRGVVVLAMTALGAGGGLTLAPPGRAASVPVAASQRLVTLLQNHTARTRPSDQAHALETVNARRPLTHVRTVLPVAGSAIDPTGRRWLHVRLPGRPNSRKGWIPASHTRASTTDWSITVRLSTRHVAVYLSGRRVRRFLAVVGKPSTPTPRGAFFVEEAMALTSRDAGGPYALATSARSSVLQEFDGGPGQIALHGTDHLAGALWSASSHGCVRLSGRAIAWLARRIGAGVPVTVSQ